VSTNSGARWDPTITLAGDWFSAASAANGLRMVLANWGNWTNNSFVGSGIYVSQDAGYTWTQTDAPSAGWWSVASSADGTRLVALADLVYTSTNSGTTWTAANAPTNAWVSVACSADGSRLVAASDYSGGGDGLVYYSADSGTTWRPTGSSPVWPWAAVASSADGRRVVGVSLAPGPPSTVLYSEPPIPDLAIHLSRENIHLSWLLPSASFLLQQSSDLASPNWAEVRNQPTLNFTNVNYELTLPSPPHNIFYRLKQR
jgi:hypothetical protein